MFCLFMIFSFVNAQTITFNGCHSLFENQNYIFNLTGTDATGRNMYTTTPVTGDQSCGGLGTCEFKLQWRVANSRWEFLADEGNGTFTAPNLIYSNTSASTPNPPSIALGTWVENTSTTSSQCGGNLTTSNSTLSGAVQDTTLGVDKFSINSDITIYPNPTTSFLNIKSSSIIKNITIWNIQGQKVLSFDNLNTIDVSSLQSGMYLARFDTENGLKVSNFIKK